MESVRGILVMILLEMLQFFGFDNSSSSHFDNCKNNFLLLGEGPTADINCSFGSLKKKYSINFDKIDTKFCLSLCYNGDNSYFF